MMQAAKRLATSIDGGTSADLNQILTTILAKVVIHDKALELHINIQALRSLLRGDTPPESENDRSNTTLILRVRAELRRCRGENRIVLPNSDAGLVAPRPVLPLVKAVSRAHEWIRLLTSGECKDLSAIAKQTGLDQRYVSRIIPLAFLVPEMVEATLEGRQNPGITIDDLREVAALDWEQQRSRLGLSC